MAKHADRKEQHTDHPILPNCFYTDKYLAGRYQLNRQAVWEWARAGRFPKPVRLSPQCSRWRGSDVLEHEAKLAEVA